MNEHTEKQQSCDRSKNEQLHIYVRPFSGHLARDPRFDNVMRHTGYSRGLSGLLPVAIEGMSFVIG